MTTSRMNEPKEGWTMRAPRSQVIRLIVLSCILALTVLATAGDWPTYLHDSQRSGANPDETLLSPANAPSLANIWSFKTGAAVAASPIVANGTVYVGSWDGYEYALDAASGALKWKTYLGRTAAFHCLTPSFIGVTSAATVQNGVVYVGGGNAYWYALNATTGAVLWRVYTGDTSAMGGHYNWSSPLLYNGDAYIGIASLCDAPLIQGQLLQVDLATHQITHTFNAVPVGQVGGGIWTSPSVDPATNTLYVTTGTNGVPDASQQPLTLAIVALDATTLSVKDAWQVPAADQVFDSDWGDTPLLLDDASGHHLVASINKNGYLYVFDRTQLSAGPLWRHSIATGGAYPWWGQGSVSSGAAGASRLYMAGGHTTIGGMPYNGSVRAFDPVSGTLLWEHGASGPVIAALAYANGLVVDGGGSTVEVLDATSGARLYGYTTGGAVWGAPSIAAGRIYVGSTDGKVYAFGPASRAPHAR